MESVIVGTVLAGVVLLSGVLTAVGAGTAYTPGASDRVAAGGTVAAGVGGTAAASVSAGCEYWTTDEGVSAVVVTSGANCGTKSFRISSAPYHGAVFSYVHGETAFNSFLTQLVEFVNGPASAPAPFGGTSPSVEGLKLIGSADNEFTNYVPVYVYAGPGDVNDRAAEAMNALIHNTFEPRI